MWDPEKYLDYADQRGRPFHDLIARIGATAPRRVVDLGCGPGNLTGTLGKRWPAAILEALDSSPEMVDAARAAGLDARVLDVQDWVPADDTDVVVTNAVLHWVPGHEDLLRRWAGQLPSGAWLAMQVPANFDAPSHTLPRELAATPEWADRLPSGTLRDEGSVGDARHYAGLLADAGCLVDTWETTYVHRLSGPDAILEWITGTALRPVKAALGEDSWQRFRAELAPLLDEAYPPRGDGTTWFPFRRVFAVARIA
ncbi:trans-aconitate 2-methyltransferase [Amycolatopsis rhizosphaerae]|uniref:Trans-aconitate 2-methyltransferase n=1 Tax=Amycolatopsis rhizosphaerae TaxID=2053003 RepID=A0A558DAX3_9PSEU|nr:trans-aconitate 2-methyltransferase [Amycolatopsis rhizosphaerae]TVT58162.1 trans-aconitate 2-methyltransferase [Amycolatopsis rhizosphaerae]